MAETRKVRWTRWYLKRGDSYYRMYPDSGHAGTASRKLARPFSSTEAARKARGDACCAKDWRVVRVTCYVTKRPKKWDGNTGPWPAPENFPGWKRVL